MTRAQRLIEVAEFAAAVLGEDPDSNVRALGKELEVALSMLLDPTQLEAVSPRRPRPFREMVDSFPSRTAAAAALGIARSTLYQRLAAEPTGPTWDLAR